MYHTNPTFHERFKMITSGRAKLTMCCDTKVTYAAGLHTMGEGIRSISVSHHSNMSSSNAMEILVDRLVAIVML